MFCSGFLRDIVPLFSASSDMTGAQRGSAAQRLVTFNLHLRIVTSISRVLEWISEDFLPENRRRLKAAHSYLSGELQSMCVPYLDRPAALYVWADLRKVPRSVMLIYLTS